MHDEELRQLINDSPLDLVLKRELLQMLDRAPERDREKFLEVFDQYIERDITERGATYEKGLAILEQGTKAADDIYEQARAQLDKEVEQQLEKLESTDIEARAAVWESYDTKMESLQKTHYEALKKAAAAAYVS